MNRKLFIFSCIAPLACDKYLSALSGAALLTSVGSCPVVYHCDDFSLVSKGLSCAKKDLIMSPTLKRFFKSDPVGDAILKKLECARWIPTSAPIEGEDLSRCGYATAAFYLAPTLYNPPICTNITPPMLRITSTRTTTSVTSTTSTKTLANVSAYVSKSRSNFTANDMCPPLDCPELASTTTRPNVAVKGEKAFSRTPAAIILANSESFRSSLMRAIPLIIYWACLLPYFLEEDPIFLLALSLASKTFL